MNTYRVETTENGEQVIFFENHAELLACCLCEKIEIDNGVCTISGICDQRTTLLGHALAAISRGHADVDGSY